MTEQKLKMGIKQPYEFFSFGICNFAFLSLLFDISLGIQSER